MLVGYDDTPPDGPGTPIEGPEGGKYPLTVYERIGVSSANNAFRGQTLGGSLHHHPTRGADASRCGGEIDLYNVQTKGWVSGGKAAGNGGRLIAAIIG